MDLLPSQKLRTTFGWLLNDISDHLSKKDCSKIAHAEQIPKSLINSDCDEFEVELLHLLQTRGRYGPLNPDGLIDVLEKAKKIEAIEEVQKYKADQRYREESKEYLESKKHTERVGVIKPTPENTEEFEVRLALMKTKTFTIFNTLTKAVSKTESMLEQYKNGSVAITKVTKSFEKLSTVMEESRHLMRKAISTSSVGSDDSSATIRRITAIASLCPADDENVYEPVEPLPVQDTQGYTHKVSRRHQKPKPLPRTKPAQLILEVPIAKIEDDSSGGNQDSGMGTGESDRFTWMTNSTLPGSSTAKCMYILST